MFFVPVFIELVVIRGNSASNPNIRGSTPFSELELNILNKI